MDDVEYRKRVREIFEGMAKAIDRVDPDVLEAELAQGVLTILSGKQKTILSPQPPVQQIWLAAAAQGIAVHFSLDAENNRWLDDKGKGLELYAFTEEVLKKASGQTIRLT